MPSGYNRPLGTKLHWVVVMNSVSSDVPSTISGVDIGRNTSRFVAARPRNEWRTRARAMSTPMVVAMRVERAAMTTLRSTASPRPAGPSGLSQASMLKPFHVRLARPVGSLKLNAIITRTGKARYATATNT